jgi:hypothetical protein
MDHFHAQLHRQAIERAVGHELRQLLGRSARHLSIRQQTFADVQ